VIQLAGPVLATAAILKFLAMYNQCLWSLMALQEEGCRPVVVGLQYFFQQNVAWGEVMAYLSMITVPVLAFCLYLPRLPRVDCFERCDGLNAGNHGHRNRRQMDLGQLACP
jgi:ABC-type glycerol-3-phosphate transport system permease component